MPQTVDPKQVSKAETPGASEKDLQQNNATSEHQQTTAQSPVKELNTSTAQGPLLTNAISDAMERNLDQRQEQQLYASVWGNCGAVLLKVIPSAAIDYRRQAEQLQNQIDLLITEKKRRGKRFDARDPRIFSQLVTVLGEQGANSLIEAIDGAVAKHGAALQNNPKAVAKLLTEISQALSSGGMLAKLGISPQAVEAAVQSSTLVPAVNPIADLSKFDSDIPVKEASAAAAFIEGEYLAETLRKNTADQLTSVQGVEYLTEAILEQKSEAGRLNTLKNIKNALGEERFEQFLDTYSRLKGEALMTTLLSREGQTEAQKKQIISAYLTSERALMPGSELARVKHGLLSQYGFARSAVQREQQAVKDMISQAEAEKAKALRHLEDVLELEGLKKLPEAQAIEKIRAALKARYPKLKTSADLSDIVTQLKEVVGSEDPKTQDQLEALGWKGDSLSNDESEAIKQNLVCICDNLLTIERKNEEIKAYQLVAREGHAGEAEFVDGDFEIYKTTLGLSDQEMILYVERAVLYRAGLEQRIKNASAKDREALCQERDQLDWRSMSARIEHHLRQDPPNLERAQALLSVYQISAGTSGAERTATYRTAAESVGKTINAIEEYNKKLKACIDTEDAEVQKHLDHLKKRFNADKSLLYKRQKALDALWFYKTEATRLVKFAQRDLSLSTERYNASQQSGVPYNNRLGDYGRGIDQTRNAALQGILSPMQVLPTAFRRDAIEGVFDRPEVLRERRARGGPEWSINDNEALKDLITSAQALEDLFSSTSEVTRELGNRPQIELPTVNLETPESREALRKLYQIDTVDPTMEPSDAALEALKECVAGSDNEAFAVLTESGTNRDRLNQLYPRLSPEDSLRVKAFLLSYDDPSMFSHFGDVPEMQTPKDVWSFLQTVSENETAQELSGFMDLLPNLHRLRKTTALLDSLGAEDRADLDVSYSQLTSRGVGEYLIDNAPVGEARIAYLRELVSTESLTGDQLRSLFPEGRVPEGIKERTQLFDQLCLKDRDSATGDFERFESYLKAHVQEEGELRGALPTLIQMQRTEAALDVTRRLEELEAAYQREFKSCFEGISEDELNRRGIRSAYAATRTGLVGFAQQHAMNPNGEMSQKAFQFLKLLEREGTPFEVVEDSIRTLGFSESQMRVFEAHYSKHVATRQNGQLTGNFAVDIAARNDTSQDVSRLIQGGEALTAYDLEQLSEGMRTQNATLTLRAMVAIKAREGAAGLRDRIAELDLPEKWRQVKNSDEAKLVREYIDAAVHNDTVRMGVVELANMARNGAHWAGEGTERALHTIGSWSSDRRDDAAVLYRQLTGEDFGVSLEKFGTFRREIWNDIVSSEPAKRTGAALAIAGEAIKDGVLNLDLLNFSLNIDGVDLQQIKSFLDAKAGRMKDALIYTGGKPPTIVEYIRLHGGEMAHAEASLLEKLFEPTADIKESRALLERFVMTRDRLLFQMEQADRLHAKRSEVLVGSQEFFVNVVGSYNRSAKDADERWINRGYARDVRDIDRVMYDDQRDLLRGHRLAMGDIESTREIMRVRSVALLTDLVENRDRGLSADSNDRDFRDLRIRDSKHEWVIARREVVERWARESEIARKKLADADWWADTTVSVAKVAVIIGVSIFATPGAGLAVALALNAAEKVYLWGLRGMDLDKALLLFGVEAALDVAFFGMGRVLSSCFGRWFARVPAQSAAKEGAKKAGTEVTKQTVNTAGKEGAEQALKESGETFVREGAEEGFKKAGTEVAEQTLNTAGKEGAEQALKESGETFVREGAEEGFKKAGTEAAEQTLNAAGKEGAEQALKEGGENLVREGLEEGTKKAGAEASEEISKIVEKSRIGFRLPWRRLGQTLEAEGREAMEELIKALPRLEQGPANKALGRVIKEGLDPNGPIVIEIGWRGLRGVSDGSFIPFAPIVAAILSMELQTSKGTQPEKKLPEKVSKGKENREKTGKNKAENKLFEFIGNVNNNGTGGTEEVASQGKGSRNVPKNDPTETNQSSGLEGSPEKSGNANNKNDEGKGEVPGDREKSEGLGNENKEGTGVAGNTFSDIPGRNDLAKNNQPPESAGSSGSSGNENNKETGGPDNDSSNTPDPDDDPKDPPASDPIPVFRRPDQEKIRSAALQPPRSDAKAVSSQYQNATVNSDKDSLVDAQSQANAGAHMHGVRQAEAAKQQQAQRNAHMEANANLAAQSETNRNIEAQKSSNAEKERVKQAQTQRESLLQKAKIAQRSKEARAQGREQEMSMSRSLKDVSDQNADGLKEAQTASLKDREAHDLLAESEASDLNSDAHVEAELAKNGQIHEEAQIQSLSEQEIIAQKSRETDADSSIERKVSKQASEYEEKLRAETERATAVELSQKQKELTEALVSDSSDSEVHHANAQNKAQHSMYNKEGEHATGDIASEAKQEAISANMSKAGVEQGDSAEVQTVEGAVGAPSFTTQQASISKNMEKLIANLSDQVGNDVQEAASFLAGLDEAPKMMTADRSSQTLLDGSTIDVANTISEVGDAMDVPRRKSADAKRRAIKKTKRRREIEVLIQVLLTRQMESSKREKLLRMLLALGISEIEYRALVSKLGELEVAAQAMAAEARKTAEKEREALLVEPLLREPESPKMKSHENDPSAPPTIKSAPSVTRGAMYQRLLKEKEKNSN